MSDTQRTKAMAMKFLYATVALIFKKNLFGMSLFPIYLELKLTYENILQKHLMAFT